MASWSVSLVSLAVLIATGMAIHVGRAAGERQLRHPAGPPANIAFVQAAVSALLGLLLAFTVNSAANRFDGRRRLIVDEANAIGTAWLRIDLLPEDAQPALRGQFRDYLDSRIATYRKLPDLAAVHAELERSKLLQHNIWLTAVTGAKRQPTFPAAAILLLPALNQMIDITTTRTMASSMHPPMTIFAMLVMVLLASAAYVGYSMAGQRISWPHTLGFVILTVFVFSVILDLEYPRLGFLREESFDRALVDLRASWH
jgi:hypothetical protein